MGVQRRWLVGLTELWLLLGTQAGLGQSITLDGSLGPIRALGNGPVYTIRQADGTTVGTNLFHSFGRFNLTTGEIAGFQSAAAIQTILARVTGGSPSSIDGLIFTGSSAVNLFLINPSGIVFGPNASLDIGGTTRGDFTATTLDAIVWPDGSRFDAVNPGGAAPLLRIVGDPSGFLASQRQIPGMTVDGSSLAVPNTQSLRLLGGNVEVNGGYLEALGGRIAIGAVTGPGTLELQADGSLQFPEPLPRANVRFTNASQVLVPFTGGGDIQVVANDIAVLDDSTLGGGILGLGTATSQAGAISLDGTGTVRVENDGFVFSGVLRGAVGRAGDVVIRAKDVVVRNRAQLGSSTRGTGDAGNVVIEARDSVLFENALVSSVVLLGAIGKGGNIDITTARLEVKDGAALNASTLGQGDAGNVVIRAKDRVLFQDGDAFSQVLSSAIGQGGNVEISTRSLEVRDGSKLSTLTAGNGNAGNIQITASDRVLFLNASALTVVSTTGTGNGGNIEINTGNLEVRDGTQLLSSTRGLGDAGNVQIEVRDSTLFQSSDILSEVDSRGTGNGGNIEINTGSLELLDGSQLIANTRGTGDSGTVRIEARDNVRIQGTTADGQFISGAFSSVRSGAKGQGGNVEITANSLEVLDSARLIASTSGLGDAGAVRIKARDSVLFQSGDAFSTVEAGGTGQGGDVEINTGRLDLLDGSQLLVSTRGLGDAGNVRIAAHDSILFQSRSADGQFSSLAASTVESGAMGQGGNIEIKTDSLVVRDSAQINASTRGQGDAGNVTVVATQQVILDGSDPFRGFSSGIFTQNIDTTTQIAGTGKGGNVNLSTDSLRISNGAVINARTTNDQTGGDISLNLNQLDLLTGGQIISTSDGSGSAGTVRINATAGIRIAGRDPSYADRLARFSTAVAPITANSGIYVRSTATGAAGNVIIGDQNNTPRLILDGGEIVADSNAVNGGNISLTLTQALAMGNGSLISATAGRAQAGGDGGNITINAPFALSIPQENNDIIANAFSGTGGNIAINAEAILNFTLNDKGKTFEQLRSQPTNDISASSQFGGNGTLNLAGLNVDPSRGSVQLPIGLIDNSNRIDNPCLTNSKTSQGSFIITGRGGLTASPSSWRSAPITNDWLSLSSSALPAMPPTAISPELAPPLPLEANTWQQNTQGIQLLASHSLTLPQVSRSCDIYELVKPTIEQ